jgi:hypothetical protein
MAYAAWALIGLDGPMKKKKNMKLDSRHGEEMNIYKFLIGKPEGKRPLGRYRYR